MKRIRFLTLSVVFFALIEVAYAQDLATQEESNKKLESSPRILKVIPPKPGIYSSNTAMDFEVRFDKPQVQQFVTQAYDLTGMAYQKM